MKNRLRDFISDWIQYGSVLCSLLLLAFHIYQYIDSGRRIECMIRIIFCAIYPAVVIFSGRKGIPYYFLAMGLTIEQYSTFNNYTAFLICCLFLLVHPNVKIWIILIYAVDVIVVCERHDRTAIHLIIHFINCGFIYFAIKTVMQSYKSILQSKYDKLHLEEGEIYILQQLASGARQKEIDKYSENTVSKKLKKARDRNNCNTNQELILRFIAENPVNTI